MDVMVLENFAPKLIKCIIYLFIVDGVAVVLRFNSVMVGLAGAPYVAPVFGIFGGGSVWVAFGEGVGGFVRGVGPFVQRARFPFVE